ncbi:MAG: flagellar motor switch protein FliM [Gammaproteobacteria bacterium]|nr:flagellar motor switch protein FliM [Gammaproteobacteria bacterium]
MASEPVLNQEEVDALLNGMNEGRVSTGGAMSRGEARRYELGHEARVVRGRLPTLEIIHQRFGPLYRTSLGTILRRPVGLTVKTSRTMRFADYLATLPMPSSINVLGLAPLHGLALLVLPPGLVSAVVENFFGGKGRKARIEGREFTAVEERLVAMLRDSACNDLASAWSKVHPMRIDCVASECNPQFANVLPANEALLVADFEVDIDGNNDSLQVVMPFATVEPLREVLGASVQEQRPQDAERWAVSLREEIADAEVELTTVVGRAQVRLSELLDFRPGDIIPCDFTGRVTVYAEDVPVLRGQFGVSRGQQSVKVEERLLRGRSIDTPPVTTRQ